MSQPVVYLKLKSTVKEIYDALKDTKFNGFPIVDHRDKLIGLISRNFLCVLIQNKYFMSDINAARVSNHLAS